VSHLREQIRDWLKTNLAGLALAGDPVFVRLTLPLEKNLQPSLIVAGTRQNCGGQSQGY
jgi:hypothetical protein